MRPTRTFSPAPALVLVLAFQGLQQVHAYGGTTMHERWYAYKGIEMCPGIENCPGIEKCQRSV